MNNKQQTRVVFYLLAAFMVVLTVSQFEYKDLIVTPVSYCMCLGACWYMGSRNFFRVIRFYQSNKFDLNQDALSGSHCINEAIALQIAARDRKSIGFVHIWIQVFFSV
jgi:nitrate/nitrite transporter NarK